MKLAVLELSCYKQAIDEMAASKCDVTYVRVGETHVFKGLVGEAIVWAVWR